MLMCLVLEGGSADVVVLSRMLLLLMMMVCACATRAPDGECRLGGNDALCEPSSLIFQYFVFLFNWAVVWE